MYKRIILIWFNIKKLYREHTLLFLLVIFSTMVSTFGIFFFTSYLAGYYDSLKNQAGDMLVIEQSISKNMGEALVQGILELDVDLIADIVCENVSENISDESTVKGEYHKNYNTRLQCGRLLQIEEDSPVAVIDEFCAEENSFGISPIGQSIDLYGKEYEIVGVCTITENDEIIIPVAYYLQNFETTQVAITFERSFSKEKRHEIEMILEKYGVMNIAWKSVESPWENVEFWINFVQILMVFVIIAINIFVLIHYLIHKNKRNYCIYSICGGNDKEISAIIFGQIFIHLLMGNICGLLASCIFFKVLGAVEWLYYGNIKFYLLVFGVIVAFHSVASFVLERKINGKSEVYQVEE